MTPRIALTAALLLVALVGCANSPDITAQEATIAAQAEHIADLTAENAEIQGRLDTCLETAVKYREHVAENKALMQGVIDKWGINYSAPIRDAMTALDNAASGLDCS